MGSDSVLTDNIDIILAHLPLAVTIQNAKGNLVYANNAAARMIGFSSPQDLLAASPIEIMTRFVISDEQGKPLSFADLPGRQTLLNKKPHERVIRFTDLTIHQERWSLVKALPIMKNGKLVGAINTFYDLTELKSTEQKLRFLTHATSTLAESPNYEQRLQKLANLIVPQFADWCTIHMWDVDGSLKRIAIAHTDAKKLAQAEALTNKFASGPASSSAVYQVMKTGKRKLFSNITEEMIDQKVKDAQQRTLLKSLKLQSVAIVPLIAREKTWGAITFVQSAPRPEYTTEDMNFFWSLATKAALLVDNARLHRTLVQEVHKGRDTLKKLRENEKALRLALEVGQMGIWDWEVQKNQLVDTSPLQGFPALPEHRDQIPYNDFLSRIEDADRSRWEKMIMQTLAQPGRYENEFRIQFPDQSKRWIFSKGEVLADSLGRPTRVIGVGIDITKRKRTEATLKQSEKKFKTIFATALDPVVIFDDALRIRDANPTALDTFRISKSGLLSKTVIDLVTSEQKKSWKKDLEMLLLEGSKRGEIEVTSTNGVPRTLEYNAVTNILPHRHMMIMRDITERKLEEKRSEHFLGIASHELKSPLASIKAMAQLLKDRSKKSTKEIEHGYLHKIDKKVDLVAYLINDLLDLTRIRQGKLEFVYELFAIDTLLQSLTDEIKIAAKQHTFKTNLKASRDIVGDRLRISQVIQNILRNATKYSPANTQITVSSLARKDGVLIQITDQGPGISPSDRKKIFDLYYRNPRSGNTMRMGLGVGLYISSQIVKQHGGDIWVEPTKKKGSTFSIFLPLRPKKEAKTRTLF